MPHRNAPAKSPSRPMECNDSVVACDDRVIALRTAGCLADSDEATAVSVTQSGNNVSVEINGEVFTGTVSDATYTGTASYPEDGGTTTVTVTFTLTSNSGGRGEIFKGTRGREESCKFL